MRYAFHCNACSGGRLIVEVPGDRNTAAAYATAVQEATRLGWKFSRSRESNFQRICVCPECQKPTDDLFDEENWNR